jgi:hypothetical protein
MVGAFVNSTTHATRPFTQNTGVIRIKSPFRRLSMILRLDAGAIFGCINLMKTKVIGLVVGALAILISGCVSTLDGHSKVGNPWARDTITSQYERPVDQIFAAAKAVLQFNGTLTGENTLSNVVEAKVDTRTVWVKVTQIDPKLTQVVVQARRRGGGTDIDLASEIDKQIALQLKN